MQNYITLVNMADDIIQKGECMKTYTNHLHSASSILIILMSGLIIPMVFMTGCYMDKKTSPSAVDMVVVFKIDVPIEKASSILFEQEYIYHEGMDNSRDKKYSGETGPKYIVKVPKEKITLFNLEMKKFPQIYEVYQADWTKRKD